ncbi:MAG: DEAD/DEAH box helicase [Oscillospiraceae bacterium]|nr:DEAD/DEAH box helicase [Oscillospiraceae bacterium]
MTAYTRFAPYIQEYIYRQNWQALRPVQEAAAEVLFDTGAHLLLSTGTASGKTEAAFLPVLTLLDKEPCQSVAVLYVSPLKALINDQFSRLKGLMEEGGVPVTKWHGDAPAAAKARLLKQPCGILQITPESLESLLMNRSTQVRRLFCDLRFIIIDEVHYFMACERGAQLRCLLARIERIAGVSPRRVGLSATLGEPEQAKAWLSADTGRPCLHPQAPEPKRRLLLLLRYFAPGEEGLRPYLYEQTLGKKTIIFTIERVAAELTTTHLKRIAARRGTPDVYRVHHGSLTAALREETERSMKRSEKPMVTTATVTLELGLDIGDLDRVVQLGAPLSVSSFTQRIGRCGRQGQPAELLFVIQSEMEPTPGGLNIDWDLVKTIAIIQLYLEEHYVEPIAIGEKPFGLLYHQTMCVLAAAGELRAPQLAQEILTLPAFRNISQEEYKTLLRHLLKINHIQRGENDGLLLGYAAEPIVTHYDFLSVFTVEEEFQVRCKGETIGAINEAAQPGQRLVLAARCWRVLTCNEAARVITVEPAKKTAETPWVSHAKVRLEGHVLQKMREVLLSGAEYPYLSPESRAALEVMRGAAKRIDAEGFAEAGGLVWFPWLGTRQLQALQLALKQQGIDAQITPGGFNPVYLELGRCTRAQLKNALRDIALHGIDAAALDPSYLNMRQKSKFDAYLPKELLFAQARAECLDTQGAMAFLTRE